VHNQVYDNKPSLTGPLPASLATATALKYLQLANNGLGGQMVELPANMKGVVVLALVIPASVG
jgi:hypothetical protein